METAAAKDTPVIWKLQNIESTYWDEYVATRPVYDWRIFHRIDEYRRVDDTRRQHAGATAALDIGTGSGSAIAPMTDRFDHVVATDNDPTSLSFARTRHAGLPAKRLSFTLSSGEDLLQHHAPQSFDLITCAETFPLMDTEIALHNILTLLRPGGTMAIWFYGPPFFTEAKFAPQCQPLLDAIMDHKFRPIVNGGGDPARQQSCKRAADGKFSWLEYIPLSADRWSNVRRHKWNPQGRLSFFTANACDYPVEAVRNIGEHETMTEEEDASFWERSWDIDMLKRFVKASFPTPNDLERPDGKMDSLFEQLMDAMGGEIAVRQFSWPAVLILASKK